MQSVEKELLRHAFTRPDSMRDLAGMNVRTELFIEESDRPVNRLAYLYTMALEYYRAFGETLTRESLMRIMDGTDLSQQHRAELASAYDEVGLYEIQSPAKVLVDNMRSRYRSHELRRTLIDGGNLYNTNMDKLPLFLSKQIYKIDEITAEESGGGWLDDSVDDRFKSYTTPAKPGIPTGFPTLDQAMNGAHPGSLYIVAAGTGEGKTIMLLNIAHHMWQQGYRVLFISIENYIEDVLRRFTSLDAGVYETELKRGVLSANDRAAVKESLLRQGPSCVHGLRRMRIESKTADCSPDFIEQKLNDLYPETFDVVFVDYLQIMDMSVKNARQEARDQYYGDLAKNLRKVGKNKRVPIFTAVQVNREGINSKGDSYGVSHIALSQQIANHADLVLSVRKVLTGSDNSSSGVAELEATTVKHRNGPNVKFGISAIFGLMSMKESTACRITD